MLLEESTGGHPLRTFPDSVVSALEEMFRWARALRRGGEMAFAPVRRVTEQIRGQTSIPDSISPTPAAVSDDTATDEDLLCCFFARGESHHVV